MCLQTACSTKISYLFYTIPQFNYVLDDTLRYILILYNGHFRFFGSTAKNSSCWKGNFSAMVIQWLLIFILGSKKVFDDLLSMEHHDWSKIDSVKLNKRQAMFFFTFSFTKKWFLDNNLIASTLTESQDLVNHVEG